MKISVITITDPMNYGAILQSYSLCKYLNEIVNEVELVNYSRKYSANSFKTSIKVKIFTYLLKSRIKKSLKFLECNLKLTNKNYKNYKELKQSPPIADTYIVGSDQVWNSDISNGLDQSFFLEYVNKGKKLSYASSFGKTKISDSDLILVKGYLDSFHAISTRESSGKQILESIGLSEVTHVLDPVFLLDKSEYYQLAIPYQKEKYLLIYGFDSNKKIFEIAKQVAKEKKLKIIEVGGARRKHDSDIFLKNLSPQEFLGVFSGAEFIVTSSFHGTAFSIIFNKNFVSVAPAKRGTRIESLLNILSLENKLIKNSDVIDKDAILKAPNYEFVFELLKVEIHKSKAFLINNINGGNI